MTRARTLSAGLLAAAVVGVGAGMAAIWDGGPGETVAADEPAQRVAFDAAARGRVGRALDLDVRRRGADDALSFEVCTAPPSVDDWDCGTETLAAGAEAGRPRLTPDAPGRWLVELRNASQVVRRSVDVAPRGGRLEVLATGDSMIQNVDAYLGQALGARAVVHSDAQISTGLSSPDVLDWVARAADQARALRPDVTVVYLGANDGFPMQPPSGKLAQCCGAAWVAEYARRVEEMMRSYTREGAGRVVWLTLPAPRDGHFVEVYGPVNEAIRQAAGRVLGATVVAIDELLAPGYRFRETILHDGRQVAVRQDDGIHISVEGAEIVADEVVAALRAQRVLPPARRAAPRAA